MQKQHMETVMIKYKSSISDPTLREMSVAIVFRAGCLAVHRRPQYPGELHKPKRIWIITHIPTGYAATGRVLLTDKSVAISVCKELAMLDWSDVTLGGLTPDALSKAARNVYSAHGLL